MKSILVGLIVLSSVIGGSGFGANYATLYKEQVQDAEKYTCIDPIINENGEIEGFIFSDTANSKVVIDHSIFGCVILQGQYPIMTINYVHNDSLVVYCLHESFFSSYDKISRFVITNDTAIFTDSITPPIDYIVDIGSIGGCSWNEQKISFISWPTETLPAINYQIIVDCSWYETTQGFFTNVTPQTLLYNNSLHTRLLTKSMYGIQTGYCSPAASGAYVGYSNYSSTHSHEPEDSYHDVWTRTDIISVSGISVDHWGYTDAGTSGVFMGNFSDVYSGDEIVYWGANKTFDPTAPDQSVAACFSYQTGNRQTLWVTQQTWSSLDYFFADKQALAGKRGNNTAIFINTKNGALSDSATFPSNISLFHFFETGTHTKQLNLVGRIYDTIIVYQFDEITDATEPNHPDNTPSGFSLSQNYPNPFNPTTTIAFEVPYRAHIHLTIYNMLGQTVRELVNEPLSAGSYRRIWDGKNDVGNLVASGAYFYQVVSDTYSQSKKMLLLK